MGTMIQNPTPAAAQTLEQRTDQINQMMGLVGQRRQLTSEIERLQQRRLEIAAHIKTGGQTPELRRTALEVEQQITGAQNALNGIDRMIALNGGTDARIAQGVAPARAPAAPVAPAAPAAPAIAGSAVPPDGPVVWSVSANDAMVFGVAGVAMLALAVLAGLNFLRRVRRQTNDAVGQLRSELSEELRRVSHGVEAVAVEVERIGEGQRYVTKALADKKEPVPRS